MFGRTRNKKEHRGFPKYVTWSEHQDVLQRLARIEGENIAILTILAIMLLAILERWI